MKVRPNGDFRMAGTGPDYIRLDKTKVYRAIHAKNQPDWEEKGKIFVLGAENDNCSGGGIGFLLEKGEYEIVREGDSTEHG